MNRIGVGILGVVCSAVFACAVEQESGSAPVEAIEEVTDGVVVRNGVTGEQLAPIERIDFESGAVVAFFEPAPGELVTLHWGKNGSTPPISGELAAKGLSPTELYEELTGEAAPDVLVHAQLRREELEEVAIAEGKQPVERLSADPPAPSPSDVAVHSEELRFFDCKGEWSYDEWFNCSFCTSGYGFPYAAVHDYTWMWSTGTKSYTVYDQNFAYSTVAVHGGQVTFKIQKATWFSWGTELDVNINSGFYAGKSYEQALDFDLNAKVYNASGTGDAYHFCGHGASMPHVLPAI